MAKTTINVVVALDVESDAELPPRSAIEEAAIRVVKDAVVGDYHNGFDHELVNTTITPGSIGLTGCVLTAIHL